MPILSADSKRLKGRSSDAGFSLVELLAVLTIMSLMVGAVVMSIPAGPSAEDRDTQMMVDVVQARLDEAALAGEMRALRLTDTNLDMLRGEGADLVLMAELPWPDRARVIAIQGETALDLSAETPPLIWVEPYGAVPDLEITLRGTSDTFRLSFDDQGRLTREAL
ncbi:MAG: prepilin-type N-terminal cleavage/methylation domain-containing protein [Pseudomonadota bacterium]